MNFTPEQRAAIEARGHVIVSASAGSGKTAVMIERLVSLILGGADVRSVLAVTFTEKAAAQMRDKLRTALLERIGQAEGADRARLKEQLAALPLAQVSTLHAFCNRLVRANFFLAGVDASFRIAPEDDAEGMAIRTRALDETLEHAYEEKDSALFSLLSVYFRRRDTRLRALILDLYDAVRGHADYRELLLDRTPLFQSACECVRGDFARRIRAALARARDEAETVAGTKGEPLLQAIENAADALLRAPDLFSMAAVILPEFPRKPRAPKDEALEYAFTLLSSSAKEIKEVGKELSALGSEERERELCTDAEERAAALCTLTLAFDEVYERLKSEANVLDYNDLEHLALKVLRGSAGRDIASRYRYVFVDEYQDINPVQDEILSLIAGEDVFFVGDGKQAIYSFRGSDSRFFEQKTKTLPVSLALSENFRSSNAVLAAVNRAFASAEGYLPMRGGARYGTHRGEVRYVVARKAEEVHPVRGVYAVTGDMEAEKKDPVAERTAQLIERELVSGTYFDADTGEERRVTFGDIAVLARKRSGFAERVVRALEERDIPVTSATAVNICDFFEARLLLDALSYLDNGEQDIPLASVLLSAAGGFDESELCEIRLRYPAEYNFRDACKRAAEGTDALGQKLSAFFDLMGKLRDDMRTHTAAETANTLLSLGLEAQIAAKRDGELRLTRIRKLIAGAEGKSVHAFLAGLKATNYTLAYAGGDAEGAVKVLTMHASKGLEYPVVFLVGLDSPFHNVEREDAIWTDAFRLAPKSYDKTSKTVYENMLRRAASITQEQEDLIGERNLFYVAMTRARYRLFLVLDDRDRAVPAFTPNRFSDFLDFFSLPLETEEEGEEGAVKRLISPVRADADMKDEVLARYRVPYPYADRVDLPVKSSATDLLREEEGFYERDSEAEGKFDADRGTAFHRFLQYVRFGADAGEELARMREEGLLTEEQCSLLKEEELRAILALPCMQLAGKKLRREMKFLLRLPASEIGIWKTDAEDEVVFQGAIDLLVEEEGSYRIVDYKHSSRTDESLKAHYAPQIALYRKAVSKAFRIPEERIGASIVNIALLREIPMDPPIPTKH